ncbi:hypothetical protein Tco_0491530 [Tanacetum coccineum]
MSSYNHFSCSWCGGPFNGGNCPGCSSVGSGNEFVYDPNPYSYNETPNFFNHPPQPQYETYSCELCGNDSHYGFDCPPWFPLVYEQEPCYNQNFGDNYYPQNSSSFSQQYLCCENCGGPHENFQCQPRNQNYFESNPCYNPNSYGFDQPTQTFIDHQPPKEMSVRELLLQEKLHKALQAVCEKLNQQEQSANESTIPLNEITSQIPPITPVLPTIESEDSLIMGDENLSTIPANECDFPFYDNFVTFSNPIFDANDDFTSSDDELLPEEDDIESKDSYVSNLDEPGLLVIPLFDANEDECFDPGVDIDEINAFLDIDISTDIEDSYHDSEGYTIYLENLLIKDTIPNLPPEVFLDHDQRSLKDEPD